MHNADDNCILTSVYLRLGVQGHMGRFLSGVTRILGLGTRDRALAL